MSNIQSQAPHSQASVYDWKAWLEELREMPSCAEVIQAIKRAEKVVRSASERRHPKRGSALVDLDDI